jgi:UDP-sulfoquinovose synthase
MRCPYYRMKDLVCDSPVGVCGHKDAPPGEEMNYGILCGGDLGSCAIDFKPTILILGGDGYLGWAASLFFTYRMGWNVVSVDGGNRRRWVDSVGGQSVTPIESYEERCDRHNIPHHQSDLSTADPGVWIKKYDPDVILHLAHQPSAPFSMIDIDHSVLTYQNNLGTTERLLWALRETGSNAHLINLATMGEYGTPDIDIPEGFAEFEFRGRKARLPFPRQPGSRYHETKVYMSHLIHNAVKWGWIQSATEIMQGPVFGIRTKDMVHSRDLTRLDADEYFGTVINRFVVQALHPEWKDGLTVYGSGGQQRCYLTLEDSMQAISLLAENPPAKNEYRVVNQFESRWSVLQLAKAVQSLVADKGFEAPALHVENPRIEMEEHYYNPDRETLPSLGWKPESLCEGLAAFIEDVQPYVDRANLDTFLPSTRWG